MSTSCGVVEQPDHHCGDDLVNLERYIKNEASLPLITNKTVVVCHILVPRILFALLFSVQLSPHAVVDAVIQCVVYLDLD